MEFDLGEANAAAPFPRLAPRSTGRPRGSPNKRTLAMRETYLKMGYAHPMLWMGEVLSRPVAQLADELGCDKAAALDLQRKVAADLAPYLESKMPTQLATGAGEGLPVLVVGEMRAARLSSSSADDGAMAIDDDLVDAIEQYQAVSDARAAKSHGGPSHEAGKGEQVQSPSPPDPAD